MNSEIFALKMSNSQSVNEGFGKFIVDVFDKVHSYLANLIV